MHGCVDEQLKRIAEFGRAHANMQSEARQYSHRVENHMREQLELERMRLHQEAQAAMAQYEAHAHRLQKQVDHLTADVEALTQERRDLKRALAEQLRSSAQQSSPRKPQLTRCASLSLPDHDDDVFEFEAVRSELRAAHAGLEASVKQFVARYRSSPTLPAFVALT